MAIESSEETVATAEPDVPDSEEAIDEPADEARRGGFKRAIAIAMLGLAVLVGVGVFVVWRSLTAIERVPFDQSSARERLDMVDEAQAEEFEAVIEEAEIASLDAAADEPALPLDEEDLLGGVRTALADNEITDDFLVPFAASSSVDDSVYDSYLLIGSDLSGALADVIIYLLSPTDGSAPIMVSLPRDLYLPNPCTRSNTRLNAALNGCGEFANGAELLGLMVEDFTGVPVDHFLTVDFDGFAHIVDAFGGLEICVDNPVRDRKAFLELDAGCHLADGETVLAWVRSRQTLEYVDGRWSRMDGVSDFSRQERQQQVLIDIAAKLTSYGSITAFGEVVAGLQDSVTFDEGLDFAALIDTAWDKRDLDLGTVERLELSFENYVVDRGEFRSFVLIPTMPFEEALQNTTVAIADAGGA